MKKFNEKSEKKQIKDSDNVIINSAIKALMEKIRIDHERWMVEQEHGRKQWLERQKQEKEIDELRWNIIKEVGDKMISKVTPLIESALSSSRDLEEDDSTFIAEIQKGGRVAVPKPFRKYHNLNEGDIVIVNVRKNRVNAQLSLTDDSIRQKLIS